MCVFGVSGCRGESDKARLRCLFSCASLHSLIEFLLHFTNFTDGKQDVCKNRVTFIYSTESEAYRDHSSFTGTDDTTATPPLL